LRVRDAHDARLHAEDAPRGVPQLEDVAAIRLDREVLVQGSDRRSLRLEEHAVLAGVRDRAARGHGGDRGALGGAEAAVHPVPV
jgi:hypothetical protein